jgi:hypothetical protein
MEIKVGDYVRFDGEIAKIRDIKRYKTKENIYVFDRILDLNEDRSCNDNTIYNSQWKYFDNVKSSPNIIDILEVGDYVNGEYVTYINKKDNYVDVGYDDAILRLKDIKSIVTKEQFSSMEYKIND